ncbi:MAG: RHS repeat-associated core domain-containing protein [Polyangiaceae bacterium]
MSASSTIERRRREHDLGGDRGARRRSLRFRRRYVATRGRRRREGRHPYLVDGLDRRVGKKRNGTLEKAWLYRDGLNPVAELDGTGALVSRFVYASRPNVPEYMVRGGVTYRILSDHLGSPRAIADVTSGTVAWRADYDAWGNRAVTAGTEDFVPFGFAGGIHDADTRLVRFGARDYDPQVGRWTAKDPLGFVVREVNAYTYSGGDPVNRIDVVGLNDQEFGNFVQCVAALAVCRFTVCLAPNPVAQGACAACILAAVVGPCAKPFGAPDPAPKPPPVECPPGFHPGGWLQPQCVEDVCTGSGCPHSCEPPA